jgi:hypothetical protein
MIIDDLQLSIPALMSFGRLVRLSTDAQPTVDDDGGPLQLGTELLIEDTGYSYYWNGTSWVRTTFPQKFDLLVELAREIRDRLVEKWRD